MRDRHIKIPPEVTRKIGRTFRKVRVLSQRQLGITCRLMKPGKEYQTAPNALYRTVLKPFWRTYEKMAAKVLPLHLIAKHLPYGRYIAAGLNASAFGAVYIFAGPKISLGIGLTAAPGILKFARGRRRAQIVSQTKVEGPAI